MAMPHCGSTALPVRQCCTSQKQQRIGNEEHAALAVTLRMYFVEIWALSCTFKLVYCIPLYSVAFPILNIKTWKKLNSIESDAAAFCNLGFPPSHVLSSFLVSLHKGLQSSLSPLFEQTHLEHVTWTISIYMSSPNGFKSLLLMIWPSIQYDCDIRSSLEFGP